jgi:hypothetical protein
MRMSLGAALLSVTMVGRAARLLVGRAGVRAAQPLAGQEAAPRVPEPFVAINLRAEQKLRQREPSLAAHGR